MRRSSTFSGMRCAKPAGPSRRAASGLRPAPRLPNRIHRPIHDGMRIRITSQSAVRPLLKWAGGKRQLLPVLAEHYPAKFTRYVEAFVGSGAVFFDLLNRGRLAGCRIQLSDVNPDLIGCYWMVRDRTDDVIRALRALAREYR